MEYILGVDGGGTKTTAILYNDKMEVLGHFLGGPMNLQVVSEEKIKDVFQKMLNHFNLKAENIKIGVGAAGAGRLEDVKKLESILKDIGFKKYRVSSDAHIGLLAIHGKNSGMMIISGTGSIGFAIKDSALYRKGGWGHLLGDEGSGYFMGLSLSKELFHSFDKDTSFPKKILNDILDLKRVTNLNSVGFVGGIIENDTIIREKLLFELKKLNIEFIERKYTNEYGATLLLEN